MPATSIEPQRIGVRATSGRGAPAGGGGGGGGAGPSSAGSGDRRALGPRSPESRTHLSVALRHHERIQRELPALGMRGQLESIRQQGLQHRLHLRGRRVGWRLGLDVESIGADPVRPTGDLRIFPKPVRRADQLAQRRADAREPAAWQQADSAKRERAARPVRLDRHDVEPGSAAGRAPRRLEQAGDEDCAENDAAGQHGVPLSATEVSAGGGQVAVAAAVAAAEAGASEGVDTSDRSRRRSRQLGMLERREDPECRDAAAAAPRPRPAVRRGGNEIVGMNLSARARQHVQRRAETAIPGGVLLELPEIRLNLGARRSRSTGSSRQV